MSKRYPTPKPLAPDFEAAFTEAGFPDHTRGWGFLLRRGWDGPPDADAIRTWAAETYGANTPADEYLFGRPAPVAAGHDYSQGPPPLSQEQRR